MHINDKQLAHFARSSQRVDKQGYLFKKGFVNTSFKRRWFVLKGNLLFYFKDEHDKDPIGVLVLERFTIETCHRLSADDLHCFSLHFDGDPRSYEIGSKSEDESVSWMQVLAQSSYATLQAAVDDLRSRVLAAEKAADAEAAQRLGEPVADD